MTLLKTLIGMLALVMVVLVNTIVVMWCERKWMGHMQSRQGPMRTGFHGALQPFADALKLLGKEDLVPAGADRILYLIAPIIAFTPSILVYAATPWVAAFTGASFDVGIFMVFAIAALFPVGILVAGWSSHNKYSLIGGFRAAAQQISYEVPMILAVLGVVMLAGSMGLQQIVEAQAGVWNVITQPFAFILFFVGMLAELNRTPFDMPEAESELVAGFNTEYSSMRFALFFVAEYMNVFTWSLLTVLLFLGGWSGPLLPGIVWLFLKTYLLVFVIIWVRATFPRVRVDQLMEIGWKLLLPAALLNVLITAVGIVTNLVVLSVLEFAAAAALVWLVSRLGKHAGDRVREAAVERHAPPRTRAAEATVASTETEGATA
ncbi:MAG: NADH-quinone oxidoreductase subunit NuoH [Coriobacteriales bacterium]|nr:NADH-quinone oxidoreductase subunit NuoH [Coriobacteriales bacterium]